MATPIRQFNPYSNSSGNTNFLSRFNRPAVMPQQGMMPPAGGFDTNGPDVNSPYFSGFSAPMPNGYNTGAPVNFNSMVDSFGQPYAGRGSLANDAIGGPDVNNPLFSGFSAPMPNNMFDPMYNAPDVNSPYFAGFSATNPTTPTNKLVQQNDPFYQSPEYKQFQSETEGGFGTMDMYDSPNFGMIRTADMYDSPNFGSISSGSIGRAMDAAYEKYKAGLPAQTPAFNQLDPSSQMVYAGGSKDFDFTGGGYGMGGTGAYNPATGTYDLGTASGMLFSGGMGGGARGGEMPPPPSLGMPLGGNIGGSAAGTPAGMTMRGATTYDGMNGPMVLMPQQPMSNVATSNPAPPAMAQTPAATSSNIDPAIQPYLSYGLNEAQRLYQAGGPQYYGGPTFVSPSITTQTGLQALEARAKLGNPLLQSAQNQLQGTVSGDYLSGNPFFQGAFQPAAKAAESQFKTTLGDIASKSSLAGRYGSGAMGSLQDRATGVFGQQLADTAGKLAYQNYEAERGRQQAATMAAPTMTSADYQDIQNLLNAGQLREGYTGQQLQSDMARFNFLQNQPQQNLQAYLQSVYGNPTAKMQQQPDTSPSGLQNLLGTAALLGGVEKDTKWLSSGWNKLFGE